MKKNILLCLLLLSISSIAFAKKNSTAPNKCIHKGNFTVSAGYGFPSILRLYLKTHTNHNDLKVTGEGPFLVKVDYMILKRWSIGFNGSLNKTKLAWMDDGYDPAIQGNRPYEYGIKAQEISGTFRFNYHYKVNHHFDFYGGGAFGYGQVKLETYTLAPLNQFAVRYDFPRPYNFELTTGVRYFPTKHVGLYADLGIGKSWLLFNHFIPEAIIQGGLVLKM